MEIKRGDVVRVRLDPVEGSEQAGERPAPLSSEVYSTGPAVVISPDIINKNSPVIVVAAVTSKKTLKVYPFEVLVNPTEGGLTTKSKVLLLHIRSIDKKRIIGSYGRLSQDTMEEIDDALKIAVGLYK